jgi:AraC-like DNA-binding protein
MAGHTGMSAIFYNTQGLTSGRLIDDDATILGRDDAVMKATSQVTYYRDPQLPGFEVQKVLKSRHAFPRHYHEGIYVIGLMEKGQSYCVRPGDDKTRIAPGEVALFNPSQVHSGVPVHNSLLTYHMIYVDEKRLQALAGDICEKPGIIPEFNRIIVRNPVVVRRLWRLLCLLEGNDGQLEKETTAVELLAQLLAHFADTCKPSRRVGGEHRIVRQAKEILASNLDCKIYLQNVAHQVGLSQYHFIRVFKSETAISPHVYRTECRITQAKKLLMQGIPPIQVALETGFSDQSHFTNKFRSFTGATPRQYQGGVAC